MERKQNFISRWFIGALLLGLLFIGLPAHSQDLKSRVGIKGGVNLSQLYVDQADVNYENNKIGLHAGLFAKIPFSDFVALQPELLYSNQGSKISYNGSSLLGIQSGEVRFNLHYVSLPILGVITAGPLNFQAGPYVSYLVAADVKDLKSDGTVGSQQDLDKNDFNSVDYGVAAGVALDVKGFQIGARYNYGFREVGKSDFAGRLTDNSKNSVIQLYVGFGF